MRRAKYACWIILLAGCSDRARIGFDSPGAGGSDSDAAIGSGGTGGDGGASGVGGGVTGGTGGNSGAAGADGSSPPIDGGSVPPWPDPTPCPSSAPSPLIGTWVGHIENYQFPSGSDLVLLVIDRADSDSLCGTITFGSAAPPPPVTDPDVGYPPGVRLERNTAAWYAPYEGFGYKLSGATVSGASLHFQTHEFEVWKTWCALQTSHPSDGDPPWRCIPAGTTEVSSDAGADGGTACAIVDPSSQRTVLDCDQVNLCGGFSDPNSVCACNQAGCNASPATVHDLDGQFDDTTIEGFLRLSGPAANLSGPDIAYAVAFTKN